ncbi:UDP-N-acetylmuramoyl-L-alanine--D-glutamate ligase [Kiloniella laminariae]|uniref:UDP-N-acetylmuramoylalanine--D-glutamate ligase n=1 Tax=Kiloniella laminariae TaxID=454162 RepID=A0ABT4LDX2_9PROT|nr:UDP-N-acetylmuramoyl-L-alanine--D-glutamate ligase [Kiloniella laminariae]MCZ4279295.1 UDP-N-acetylmuramoyl-L-alanine--D-glutamate ligase [Kiloniella laminariae]
MIDLRPYISTTNGKAFAVLGLGRSGLTAACALAQSGADVWAWDDNADGRAKAAEAGLKVVDLGNCDWTAVQSLVMSPGIPLTHPVPHPVALAAQATGVEVICEVELLYRACPDATFVGITGTNGKSTTTSLIAHILAQAGRPVAVGGNLGTPALELPMLESDGVYVLEMSSYQLDLLSQLRFDIALLLNFSPDHLDRHGDMAGYIKAKLHIFDRQEKDDAAIIGMDDPDSRQVFDQINSLGNCKAIPISGNTRLAEGVFAAQGQLIDDRFASEEQILDLQSVERLPGDHNHQNAAAAFACCRRLNLTNDAIVAGMKSFPGLAHRQQLVAQQGNIRYINDSKATNADAAARAISSYENIYWIAGGRAKDGGISSLKPLFSRIRKAYLIGECAEDFARQIGKDLPYTQCQTLDRAIAQAAKDAQHDNCDNAVVLLSPACASWDQYRSFEVRGDHFRECVQKLTQSNNLEQPSTASGREAS